MTKAGSATPISPFATPLHAGRPVPFMGGRRSHVRCRPGPAISQSPLEKAGPPSAKSEITKSRRAGIDPDALGKAICVL